MRKTLIVLFIFTASPVMAWEIQTVQPYQWQAPAQIRPVQPTVNRYNPMNNSWSYEKQDTVNKFNPMNDSWSYESPKSTLKYNPMSDKWEYAE